MKREDRLSCVKSGDGHQPIHLIRVGPPLFDLRTMADFECARQTSANFQAELPILFYLCRQPLTARIGVYA